MLCSVAGLVFLVVGKTSLLDTKQVLPATLVQVPTDSMYARKYKAAKT